MSRYSTIPRRLVRRLLVGFIGGLALWFTTPASALELQPFHASDMRTIEQRYQNKAYILALWSLTCPPCLRELEDLAEWQQQHAQVPLVLINTDPVDDAEAVAAKLADVGLAEADNWMYGDSFVAKLRHAIDPEWRGELPRSYIYHAGSRHAISGRLTHEQLDGWIAAIDQRPKQSPETHHSH